MLSWVASNLTSAKVLVAENILVQGRNTGSLQLFNNVFRRQSRQWKPVRNCRFCLRGDSAKEMI